MVFRFQYVCGTQKFLSWIKGIIIITYSNYVWKRQQVKWCCYLKRTHYANPNFHPTLSRINFNFGNFKRNEK